MAFTCANVSSKGRMCPFAATVLLVVAGCEAKASAPVPPASSESKALATLQAKDRAWHRMKDCAEQAETIAKRERYYQGAPDESLPYLSGGYTNHYSPKYDRCYVQVTWGLRRGVKTSDPAIFMTIVDAYEGRELARCNAFNNNAFCFVWNRTEPNSTPDCKSCQKFMDDRLDN